MNPTLAITRVTIRELIHERVFHILIFFLLLSIGLSFMLGQMTYAEQERMTLDFMLAGTQLSMILFSVFMGISLLKKELALGSAAMILSKPISRGSFLLGKYLGQQLVQAVLIFMMSFITYLFCNGPEGVSSAHGIFQAGLLFFLEAMVLSAATYMAAVFASPLTCAVVALTIFMLGHMRSTLIKTLGHLLDKNFLWIVAKGIIPDLEIFNIKSFVSYGITISQVEIGWALVYALCCSVFFLLIGTLVFIHRDILT